MHEPENKNEYTRAMDIAILLLEALGEEIGPDIDPDAIQQRIETHKKLLRGYEALLEALLRAQSAAFSESSGKVAEDIEIPF